MKSFSIFNRGNWLAGTPSAGKLAEKWEPGNCGLGLNMIQRAESQAEPSADEVLPVEPVCGFPGLAIGLNIHESA